jgi:hypothetical protein
MTVLSVSMVLNNPRTGPAKEEAPASLPGDRGLGEPRSTYERKVRMSDKSHAPQNGATTLSEVLVAKLAGDTQRAEEVAQVIQGLARG